MKKIFVLILLFVLTNSFTTAAFALGPVDGEIGVALWNNDFDADLSEGDIDAGSLMIHGENLDWR